MRTSERTYLQALGFQDEDKNNPLHDQACVYLTLQAKLDKFAAILDGKPSLVPMLSHPLIEATGYRGTIERVLGYADLLLFNNRGEPQILVEVKAGEKNISKIIQQLKTYQRATYGIYLRGIQPDIVLATLYKLSQSDKNLIHSQGFIHIYLDPDDVRKKYAEMSLLGDDSQAF